jgi:hypothetical protein
MAYTGAVDHRPAAAGSLRWLESEVGFDHKLVVDDCDALGRRWSMDYAVSAAAHQLRALRVSDAIRDCVMNAESTGGCGRPLVALGLTRVVLEPEQIRRQLRAALRRQLGRRTGSPSAPNTMMTPTGTVLDGQYLEDVLKATGGSLRAVGRCLRPSVRRQSKNLDSARMREVNEGARRTLLALLKPPLPDAWWRRCIRWFAGLFSRRRAMAPSPNDAPPRGPSSDGIRAELVALERSRVAFRQLQMRLRDPKRPPPSCGDVVRPSLLQYSVGRDRVARCLKEIDTLAWQLAREVSALGIHEVGNKVSWLDQRIDELCDRVLLATHAGGTLDSDELCRLATEMLADTHVLFPGHGGRVRRQIIVPPLAGSFELADCRIVEGDADECIAVAVEAGVCFDRLCSEVECHV